MRRRRKCIWLVETKFVDLKVNGGLRLYCTKPRNIATLAKLNWRLLEEKYSLWDKILMAKYCPSGLASENALTNWSSSNN